MLHSMHFLNLQLEFNSFLQLHIDHVTPKDRHLGVALYSRDAPIGFPHLSREKLGHSSHWHSSMNPVGHTQIPSTCGNKMESTCMALALELEGLMGSTETGSD